MCCGGGKEENSPPSSQSWRFCVYHDGAIYSLEEEGPVSRRLWELWIWLSSFRRFGVPSSNEKIISICETALSTYRFWVEIEVTDLISPFWSTNLDPDFVSVVERKNLEGPSFKDLMVIGKGMFLLRWKWQRKLHAVSGIWFCQD